jgi:WD40 repeat protein
MSIVTSNSPGNVGNTMPGALRLSHVSSDGSLWMVEVSSDALVYGSTGGPGDIDISTIGSCAYMLSVPQEGMIGYLGGGCRQCFPQSCDRTTCFSADGVSYQGYAASVVLRLCDSTKPAQMWRIVSA